MTGELPATSFQERIWLAERLEPDLALYNVPMAWSVRGGALDPARLRRALAALVERHEILRARFVQRGGRLRQEVGGPWQPEVEWHDLPGPPGEREERLQAWLAEAARRRFDPASGRLLRAALLGPGGEQVLFLCVHHLVWDEPSTAVLLRELERCYAAAAGGGAGAGRPATPHQERMAFVDRFERGVVYPTAPTYHNLPLLVRLAETPDREALRAALAGVLARHEALRTTLVFGDGGLVQRVAPEPRVDLRWLEPGAALRDWAREPLDLAEGPLFRAAVQPLAEGGAWLGLVGHQAVVDRASLAVVAGEVADALAGRPVPGGSSHAEWWDRRDRERARRDVEALAGHLDGETEPLLLPSWRPRPAVHVYEERSVPLDLGPAHGREALARAEGVAVEDVVLAGFVALLSWYTGQDRLVVGTVHDGRDGADAARVVGPLANLLPLRLDVPADLSFRALVGRVARERALLRRHAAAPFDELVRRLRPATDMSRTALFDVLFQRVEASPAVLETVETGGGHGKYDLHCFLRGDRGALVYNGVLFDEPQVRAMAGHLARLLEEAVRRPATAVGDLDPLTEEERRLQLTDWNPGAAAVPDATLHGLVRERALARPDAIALVHGGERRTYRELLERSERLARGLVATGVRPGELVALALDRGTGQVEALLGVLLAGAAYLPLDPAAPAARTASVLRDAGARWAVADTPGGVPSWFAGRALTPGELERGGDGAALPQVDASALAYCIYTSGTTGGPKGVLVTHPSVVRLLRSGPSPFDFGPADVWTLFHSCAFDFSVWELFGCLATGGRLVIVPAEEARDAQRFLRLLEREGVTVLNQTPAAFAELLRVEEAEPAALEGLRWVIFGGDRLRPRALAGWMARHPHVRVVNMYGITEAAVHVTWRRVTAEDVEGDVSSVGVPLPATTVHLLDPRTGRRLLPVGVAGEIHVGGPGVAAGYLRRPALEAERFVPNPFGPGRLYRSGDLARYRPDGTLEFVGRRDAQVKLRGYRIEPEEVAAALREHPAVAEAVVLKEGDADGRLVAYVRPRDGLAPAAAELRAHAAERLPEYMVPAAYLAVDRAPLTANGKLDERALRERGTPLPAAPGREPATPTARALAAIWSDLLGVPAPAADDSFFELGGHSLLATRLLARVAADLGVGLQLRSLFEHPRLQELADGIDLERRGGEGGEAGEPLAPASSFQRRAWLAERLEPDAASYNVPQTWRVAGRLDPDALRLALGLVVERSEILRTRFVERGGRLGRAVGPPWTPELEREDLTGLPPEERLRRLEAWSLDAMRRPFDPASGRLLRAALADLDEGEQALSLCLHHLVFDAGSVPVLLDELAACYAAAARGAPLPPPPGQFGDLVADRADALERAVARLAGAPPFLALPTPPPEPSGAVPLPLAPDLLERLREVQAAHGVSWFMVAATALAEALHRWTGQDDLTFGCPVANRRAAAARVIGPCLDTAVVRSRRRPGATPAESLRAMREALLEAFDAPPFEALLERLAPPRRAGWTPYADVILNATVEAGPPPEVGGCRLSRLRFDSHWRHETKVGLTLTLLVEGGRLCGVLSHRGDRFASADVHRLAGELAALLERFLEHLDEPWAPRYRDVVLGQLAGGRPEAELRHWLDRLDGAPAFLPLPPPPPGRAGPHGVVPVPLAPDLAERLRRVQAERGVSRFTVVATALAALLHRWTGLDDVTFGSPVAMRDRPGLEEVLGPLMNTVVLRSRCEPGTTLGDLLAATSRAVLDALEHQRVPFETVVERLNPPRRAGWTPYIDVSVAMLTGPPDRALLGGLELAPLPLRSRGADHVAKFGLTLAFVDAGDRVEAQLAYRGDRFTAADAAQLARLLGRLLDRLPGSLEAPVHALDLLDGEERERLAGFERGDPAPPPETVPAQLDRQLAARPDAPAVDSSRGVTSFRALSARADAFAARLRPLARGEPAVVALALGRGEDLIAATLGAWRAGCCVCPLDPDYPDGHVDFILGDLDACAVATNEPALRRRLAAAGMPVVHAAEVVASPVSPAPEAAPHPDPESIAYVLYTSGTTGQPKGVAVRHRNLAQFARWYADAYDAGPGDRASQVASVGFDMTMWEAWPNLCAGVCVVPYERPAVVATELAPWLDERGVTLSWAPTPLAEALWSVRAPVRGLRRLFFAGSALTRRPPPDLPYEAVNTYGPTETTIIVSAQVMGAEGEAPLNCIGRPIAGAALLVLDEAGRRCPVGVPGEIHIGGAGVAAGYWRRPALTAERFVDGGAEGVLYRTGDQGRWLADGTLEFLGRRDRQLKISGYRVEPQEVEAHLREDPLVAQALVRGHAGSLAAYLVPNAGAARDTATVLARLETRLPGFMVPRAVVWLDELPLSVHGKVAADRLPAPAREDMVAATPWVAPAGDLERRIAAVWSSVLGVDAVGVHDNFFDLGGNSLLLASLHDRLREELAADLPIQRLFEHPTIHTLAGALAGGGRDAGAPAGDDVRERAARARQARSARRRGAGGG